MAWESVHELLIVHDTPVAAPHRVEHFKVSIKSGQFFHYQGEVK